MDDFEKNTRCLSITNIPTEHIEKYLIPRKYRNNLEKRRFAR